MSARQKGLRLPRKGGYATSRLGDFRETRARPSKKRLRNSLFAACFFDGGIAATGHPFWSHPDLELGLKFSMHEATTNAPWVIFRAILAERERKQ